MSRQEDRMTFKERFQNSDLNAFYAVFDGHAGCEAAHFSKEVLGRRLEQHVNLKSEWGLNDSLRKVCKSIDDEFLQIANASRLKAGTTLLVAMLFSGKFTLANLGDSSAHLLKTTGQISKLTADHTPDREDEYNRIVGNNGFISKKDNISRVDGSIAVSRAIGDRQYKQYLISDPETYSYSI
mmetsp:Transcript_39636/g.60685  ORF Transcript_39636/g.60685 Transcript_39636/m.60685 type:complete len:182 (+) Transcript_39636:780-1325(+)